MSFAELIANSVQQIMPILGTEEGGLAAKQTYVEVTSGSYYDTTTGTMVHSEVRHTGIPMVLARFKIDEMDESVVPTTDRKAIIAALDLPVDPKEKDSIELTNGMIYEVKRILGVPGNSVWILHIRYNK